MSGPWRHADLGIVDRSRPLRFSFDGRSYTGFAGDTLASALLGAGLRLVGRSFKYHRPRGIVAAGAEEPNALVRLGRGRLAEPNTQATRVELSDGLVAESQHHWPSLGFDVGAAIGLLKPFMPAGFYYKTFIGQRAWRLVEPFIRRAAGFGRVPEAPDPERYEKRYAQAHVVVVGAGPSGLAAAQAAAQSGARVLLIDDDERLTSETPAGLESVTWLPRTTVVGYYHNNFLVALERCQGEDGPRLRLWHVQADQVVLATGAFERPLTFPDNDRPGIMLAGAVTSYLERYGVVCGRRAVIFCNNDGAYQTAFALAAAGAEVAAVVDRRQSVNQDLIDRLDALGIVHHTGYLVSATHGRSGLWRIRIAPEVSGRGQDIDCDLLAMSGGWTPAVHLHSQCGGRLAYRNGAFVPDGGIEANRSVGACNGLFDLAGCRAEGAAAGAAAAFDAGFGDGSVAEVENFDISTGIKSAMAAALEPPLVAARRGHQFVDFQMDVTVADIELAAQENYVSVEHLKRYTTLGMGLDQGRTSNLPGLATLGAALGMEPASLGTTTFRPPYLPTTIGVIVGRRVGQLGYPPRQTAAHDWHLEHGAVIVEAGWQRPQFYRRDGESDLEAVNREVAMVRGGTGLVDVSTLGKIDIQGPDACEFLGRVYTNGWTALAVGRSRYGLMLRDDGRVFDDGVTSRLGEAHYHMTTTTANAEAVLRWLEFLLQVRWPELRVFLTPVTEQWFAAALTGPGARRILAPLTDVDVGTEAFPYMSVRDGTVLDITARLFRMSFTGEMTFEINVAADQGLALWQGLTEAGVTPYGVEAMSVMRIEKGHVAGAELGGQTTPDDLGLGRMVSANKDCVGKRSLRLPALAAEGRKQLVGLEPLEAVEHFPQGSQVVGAPGTGPQAIQGYVTSHAFSPTFGQPIALALVERGRQRYGEELYVSAPTAGVSFKVRLRDNHFYDPEGDRLDG